MKEAGSRGFSQHAYSLLFLPGQLSRERALSVLYVPLLDYVRQLQMKNKLKDKTHMSENQWFMDDRNGGKAAPRFHPPDFAKTMIAPIDGSS